MQPTSFAPHLAVRALRIGIVVTLLIGALLAGVGMRSARPALAVSVTAHTLSPATSLKAVACADTSTCFAVGAGGVAIHTANGSSWDLWGTDTFATLNGVACPTTAVCFAVGAGGTIQNTTSGNGGWASETSTSTQDLNAVACVSATLCYAVGAGGTILTTSNGLAWSAQSSGTTQNLLGVSCASSSLCVAVGAGGTILATTNGSTWSSETSNTTAQLNGVSCVRSTTTCYAVGSGSVFAKTTDGVSWTAGAILQSSFTFNAVACAATSTCTAVGQIGFIFGTSDGATWNSQPSGTSQALSGVACPSSVACFVISAGGAILATTNAGANWNTQSAAYTGEIDGIACPSASVCYAVGGVIAGTTDGGATWSVLSTAHGGAMNAIACASTAACTAVGGGGRILSTTDGGASWSLQAPFNSALSGVACPTTTACYAVGEGGLIERNATGQWQSVTSTTIQSLTSIACPGTTTCLAVGAGGTIVRTTNGTQWSAVSSGTTHDLVGLTCAAGGGCYALPTQANNTFYTSIDGGLSWNAGSFPAALAASRMACPGATVCMAPAWNGVSTLLMATGDAGATWLQQALNSSDILLSLDCPSLSVCALGSGTGHIYMASSQATAISLSVAPDPVTSGQPLTLTATLSSCSATGSVAFFDGLSLLGSVPIAGGQAQFSSPGLAAGVHQLTASYGGDGSCSAAVSNAVNASTAPAVPSPTSPPSGATGQSTTPTLSWTSSAGATSYTVAITDVTASQTLPSLSSTTNSLAIPAGEGLIGGHQYSWTVAACNTVGCSAASTASSFTTAVTPGTVSLVSPLEGAQSVSVTPTLSWNAPTGSTAGTTQYTAYIWDPQLNAMKFQQTTTALSVTVPANAALQAGTFYYWTVQACNGAVCGPLARWIGFTTAATLGTPGLTAPAEGSVTVSTTPTLQWTAASGATASTQYTAYIWDPNPGTMVFQQTTSGLSVTVPAGSALQGGRFYYYSAKACNGSSCGALARWEGFTTISPNAPGVVPLNLPAEGATDVSLTPTLGWTAPSGAIAGTTQYTAYVWDPQANAMRFQATGTGLSVAVPGSAGLVLGHFYYWSVQACNGSACGPLARWEGFTTVSNIGAPQLRSPAEGATGVGVTPTIAWLAPSGASPGNTVYTAYVWDPTANVMKFQQTTTALSIAVPFSSGLVSGHFYYYSVQACNGSTCGPLARWEGFTS